MNGVSIVLCSYNGKKKLPKTLEAIRLLKSNYPWELILINNNSNDRTVDVAKTFLKDSRIDYRIEFCEVPGKMNAFWMGLELAKYEYVLDCDDDNHLSENYLQVGISYLMENPRVGALGGLGLFHQDNLPTWFKKYSKSYAIGAQGLSGIVLDKFSHLYGAGCFYKKSILLSLKSKGFYSLLTCRKGEELSSGGDVEFCHAIQLSGFDLIYLESLKFYHDISKSRIDFDYYLKLKSGIASSFPILDSYKINSFPTIKEFNIHLVSIFFTVIKGVLKSTLTLKNDKESRIAKTVTRTKLVSFLKNYKEAIEGYRRNITFFDKQ
jgi:glycosyltransferase involved in cell wall biosynthesis